MCNTITFICRILHLLLISLTSQIILFYLYILRFILSTIRFYDFWKMSNALKASLKIVSPPKYSSVLHLSNHSLLLKTWKTMIFFFFTIIIVLPFRMSYNWKHQYVPFKDWLFSLRTMHLRFIIFFLWLTT